MNKFERILIALALIGIGMQLFHLTGSALLVLLSLSALSVFYYIYGLPLVTQLPVKQAFTSQTLKSLLVLGAIGAFAFGLSLSAATLGILFKVLEWAGAGMMLLLSSILLGFALLAAPILSKVKKSAPTSTVIVYSSVYGAIALTLYLFL